MEFLAARAVRDSNASERPKFFAPLKFAGGDAASWPQQADDDGVRNIRKRQRHNGLSCEMRCGWDVGIRTPITASRARCPTVERRPSRKRNLRLYQKTAGVRRGAPTRNASPATTCWVVNGVRAVPCGTVTCWTVRLSLYSASTETRRSSRTSSPAAAWALNAPH